jgi:hypothetical protein
LPYSVWDQKRKLLESQNSDEETHSQDLLLLDMSREDSKLDDRSEESYADNDGDDYEDND